GLTGRPRAATTSGGASGTGRSAGDRPGAQAYRPPDGCTDGGATTKPPRPRNSSFGCQGVALALVATPAGWRKYRWNRSGSPLPDRALGAAGSPPSRSARTRRASAPSTSTTSRPLTGPRATATPASGQ